MSAAGGEIKSKDGDEDKIYLNGQLFQSACLFAVALK